MGFPDLGALWVDLWARSLRHAEVARVREEFDARWRQVIADVVVEGQRRRVRRVDPDEFATALSALLDGLSVQLVLGDPAIDPPTAVRIAMGFAAGRLGFDWAAAAGGRPGLTPESAGPVRPGARQAVVARISAMSSMVVSGWRRARRPTGSPSHVVCMTKPICSASSRSDHAS